MEDVTWLAGESGVGGFEVIRFEASLTLHSWHIRMGLPHECFT